MCGSFEGGDDEEHLKFRNESIGVLDNVIKSFSVIVLDDLRDWIDRGKREGIAEAFGVASENENGRKVIDICVDNCVDNVVCVIHFLITRLFKGVY